MSVIQKIRDKYAKVAGFVIALALVAFILSDLASGGLNSIFGRDISVAKVNGEKIEPQQYQDRISEYEAVYSLNTPDGKLDANTQNSIRQQALQDVILQKIIATDYESIGLKLTEDEKRNLIYSVNADNYIKSLFTNPESGAFDPNIVKSYETQLRQADQTGEETRRWENIKRFVINNKILDKLSATFAMGGYVPKALYAYTQEEQKEYFAIDFVKVPFSIIPDADVKVTDADINDYLKKREKQFSIFEPTRAIEYVKFDIVPSAVDSGMAYAAISNLVSAFQNTSDVAGFVNMNSDNNFDSFYAKKDQLSPVYADTLINLSVGTVFGPYLDGNNYNLARVISKKQLPDSVKAQHILFVVNAEKSDSVAKQQADSVLALIKAGQSMSDLATALSEDPGSKDKGGDLGYFAYGMMVKEFNDMCFNGKIGDLDIVKTQFGYHIIKINDQKNFNPAVMIAYVTKSIFPSEETEANIYAQASEFVGKYNKNAEAFDKGVEEMKLNKLMGANIKGGDFTVQGMPNTREIVNWTYRAKVGDVSQLFNVDNSYIVAKVRSVQDKGLITIDENNRTPLENMVRNEKKGELIKSKFKGDLNTIATATQSTVQNADSLHAQSGFIPGIGYDMKVLGACLNKNNPLNTVIGPVVGQDGVTYFTITKRYPRELGPLAENLLMQQVLMQKTSIKNAFRSQITDNLKRNASILYNFEGIY